MGVITIFFTSLIVAFSGAMMPGPLLTVTISESSRRGAMAGPMLMLGHAILEMLLVIALLLGLAPLFKHNVFLLVVAFAGGAIMLWMAWGMFKSLPTLTVQTQAVAGQKNNLVLAGALMSLANPYWIIWWATIGLGYIMHARQIGMMGITSFYAGHIAGDLIWYTAISLAISRGKKLFTDKVYRVLIGICGVFLVAFAAYLVINALLQLKA
jgi:threonine/homoserine/homoserine lactone efflux protein